MIYLYDNSLCDDLQKSFIESDVVVKVTDAEDMVNLAAQIQNDEIKFPLIAITRDPNISIAENTNFSRIHRGVCTVFDNETNQLYYEKSIPVNINYVITVLTTNTVDMDEIIRELIFKYTDMYFLTVQLPYESDRKIRFGIRINKDSTIERKSAHLEYIQGGVLYQSILQLSCDGCVLVTYTPRKLKREILDSEINLK